MSLRPGRSSTFSRSVGEAQVLYIHPAKQEVDFRLDAQTGRRYVLIPVGVAGLVNLLRENSIPVRGLNYPMEKQLNPNFSLRNWLNARRGVRIILIDMHWYEHSYGAISVARLCKQVLPWAWTVVGGLTASGFAREILENFPEVDFIIRGDAEKPLLSLVQRLLRSGSRSVTELELSDIPNLSYRDGDGVLENVLAYTATPDELDALNFVDIDFMEHYREYYVHEYIVKEPEKALNALKTNPFWGRWLTSARGCRYHCSYCGGSKESHKRLAGRMGLVMRSPEKLEADLQDLERAGVVQASMSYDLAEMGADYWQEFFERMRSSGVNIGIYNEFFQLPEPEFIKDFSRSAEVTHTCVAMSPLSGNERVRRLNGKHYSNQALFDALENFRQNDLYVLVYFSLNLPGETQDTFRETLEIAREIHEFYPTDLLRVLNTVHTIDPVSPMNMYPDKYGIESSMTSFMDFYHYCRETQIAGAGARTELNRGFKLKDLDARSLERMANAWDAMRAGRETSWYPVPPSW